VIIKKTPEQVQKMFEAGQALAQVVKAMRDRIRPGVTTKELDDLAHKMVADLGGKPSFLGYHGFPASICASPNEVIVHGFPDTRKLEEGEIISVDVGMILDGWHADTAYTYPIGEVSEDVRRLLKVAEESLYAGIAQCRPGKRLFDISYAIQEVVEDAGFSVVREYAGHGIGREMHEGGVQVPNYGEPGRGPILEPGMVFAIEPMVNMGGWKTRALDDGWTVVTDDGSLSAHFEHTVAVTPKGPHVLTALNGSAG
jgi:methionyl aminopeptidase